MDSLTKFAEFLMEYGPYAVASTFVGLYAVERKERRSTQERYEKYLQRIPDKVYELTEVHARALDNLERSFLRAGIEVAPLSEKEKEKP